jgi:hypothetical protein
MEFTWNFQELTKIEQGAPDCTWMTNHLIKRNFKFVSFLGLLQEFNSNPFDFFYFGLLRIGLLNEFDP